jgi:oligoribonuclease (3'-5' exoribonuclease)
MPTTIPNPYLIGLDLETTGLSPGNHTILEIGVSVLEAPDLAIRREESWVLQCDEATLKRECDETVEAMHRKSGLWDECQTRGFSRNNVEMRVIKFLKDLPAPLTMFGAGIINFDRPFLAQQMPELYSLFHYRSADVSTFRVFLPLWGLELPPKAEKHRTLDDIHDAITLAKHVRRMLRP